MTRLLRILACLAAAWIALLFVLGFVLAGRAANQVTTRLSASLQAPTTIGETSLGLVLGRFSFENMTTTRDDLTGKFSLAVGSVDCDLPPLGLALVDRRCSELAVRDVRLAISTVALFRMKRPTHVGFKADHVVVDNAELVFAPSAFLPSLGQIRVKIEHAEAGATTFKSPLSWLFALEALRATLELPAGISLGLALADGTLVVRGSVFGSAPVSVPLALPKLDSTDDAKAELEKLVAFGKDLAEQLVAQKAEDWLRNRF